MAETYAMKKEGVSAAIMEYRGGYPVAVDGKGKEYVLRIKNDFKIGDKVKISDTSVIKLVKE